MSIWAQLEGTISISTNAHFSLRKSISSHFPEGETIVDIAVLNKVSHSFTLYHLHMSWCSDGMDAADSVNSWVASIKEADRHSRIDLNATIRWVN